MARKKVIQARVSEAETELVEAYCAHLGVSISELIRTLILNKATKYRDSRLPGQQPEPLPDPTPVPNQVLTEVPELPKQDGEEDDEADDELFNEVTPASNPARIALSELFDSPA